MAEVGCWHPQGGGVKRPHVANQYNSTKRQRSPTGVWTDRPAANRVRGPGLVGGIERGQAQLKVEP